LLLLTLSLLALIKFVNLNIGSILFLVAENMSNYRGTTTEITEYNANGYLRLIIQFSDIVFYLTFVYMLMSKKRNVFHIFIFVLSITISVFFYFFVQSRGGILNLMIFSYILYYFLKKRNINLKLIFIVIIMGLSLVSFMTTMRKGSGFIVEKVDYLYPIHAIEPIIISTTGIDISKTGHIINFVNDKDNFKFGSSLLFPFYAWVPRSIWPAKPVNIDTEVGNKIFGGDTFGTGGVPPGIIAEFYWNFWYIGVFIGCWLAGLIISSINNYFLKNRNGINDIMIYVICFLGVGGGLFGSSLVSYFVGLLFTLIPLSISLNIITNKRSPSLKNYE